MINFLKNFTKATTVVSTSKTALDFAEIVTEGIPAVLNKAGKTTGKVGVFVSELGKELESQRVEHAGEGSIKWGKWSQETGNKMSSVSARHTV